jgi:glucokinase
MIVLAGDIGGTNARLALYAVKRGSDGKPQLDMVFERVYPSKTHPSLELIAEDFFVDAQKETGQARDVTRACLGIAGPVENNICRATNLPWVVDGNALGSRLGIEKVTLLNDFHAAALGVTSVAPSFLVGLGGSPPAMHAPIAVLGAGTGLGEAFLTWSPTENRYQVIPSEGGHADLAPRTPLELALFHYLTAKYGRVSYERVLSGRGLIDAFTFLSQEPACASMIREQTRADMAAPGHDPAAVITQRALDFSDPVCEMAVAIFASVLGALAGNLALYALATGGVFIAGGIAPRVLPYLQRGTFREAFEAKGRMTSLVARIPAFIVTHPQLGLLGAATLASS